MKEIEPVARDVASRATFLEFAVYTAPLYVGGFCIEWGE